MKCFNEKYEIISIESVDLEKGVLVPFKTIKEDATPIDNVTKFAWADDDYEDAQMYVMYVLNQETIKAPTQLDRIEAQVAYTAMMTDTLLEV
jgi:hypothetical protein